MKKRKVDPWFPFWIDKWLHGSTVIELKPDERGIFVSLMALSKKDDGWVRANVGVPYLETQLSGLFNCTPELLRRTIKRCIEVGKIRMEKDGTFYMTSHENYKLSPRQERRIESEMTDDKDTMAEKEDIPTKEEDTISKVNKEEENKIEDKKVEEPALPQHKRIKFSFKKKEWEGILIEDKSQWKAGCPDVDIEKHLYKMKNWLIANPNKAKKNYATFIVNWLNSEQGKIDAKNLYNETDKKEIQDWVEEPIKKKES